MPAPSTAVAAPASTNTPSSGAEGGKDVPPAPKASSGAESADVSKKSGDGIKSAPKTSAELTPPKFRKEKVIGESGEYEHTTSLDRKLFNKLREIKEVNNIMRAEGHRLTHMQELLDKIYPDMELRAKGIDAIDVKKRTGKERIFSQDEQVIIALEVIQQDLMLKAAGFAQDMTNGGRNTAAIELPSVADIEQLIKKGHMGLLPGAAVAVLAGVGGLVAGSASFVWHDLLVGRADVKHTIPIEFPPVQERVISDYWRVSLAKMGGGGKEAAKNHLIEAELLRYEAYTAVGLDLRIEANRASIDLFHDPTLNTLTQGGGVSELINMRQRLLAQELGSGQWANMTRAEKLAANLRAIDAVGAKLCVALTNTVEEDRINANPERSKTRSAHIIEIAKLKATGLMSVENMTQDDVDEAKNLSAVAEQLKTDTGDAFTRIEQLDSHDPPAAANEPPKNIFSAKQAERAAEIERDSIKNQYVLSGDNVYVWAKRDLTALEAGVADNGSIKNLEQQRNDLQTKLLQIQSGQLPYSGLKGKAYTSTVTSAQSELENKIAEISSANARKKELASALGEYNKEIRLAEEKYTKAREVTKALEDEKNALLHDYFGWGGTALIPDKSARTKIKSEKEIAKSKAETEVSRRENMLLHQTANPTKEDKDIGKLETRIGKIQTADAGVAIAGQVIQDTLKDLTDPQTGYDYLTNLVLNSTASAEEMITDQNLRHEAITRADIVIEASKLFGITIDRLDISAPTLPLSKYMESRVKLVKTAQLEIEKLRRTRPADWKIDIQAKEDFIKKTRLKDEALISTAYDQINKYLKTDRYRTAQLIDSIRLHLGDKVLLYRDPLMPAIELLQPDTGFIEEKAAHTNTGIMRYTPNFLMFEPGAPVSARFFEDYHSRIDYQFTGANGIQFYDTAIITKPDSPATAGKVKHKLEVKLDQNLYRVVSAYATRADVYAAGLPLALVDHMYNPDPVTGPFGIGSLKPMTSDILTGDRLVLDSGDRRNFVQVVVDVDFYGYGLSPDIADKYLATVGKFVIENMTGAEKRGALKYFIGVPLTSFGGNYIINRDLNGQLSVTGEVPAVGGMTPMPAKFAVQDEPVDAFINSYAARWKEINRPTVELNAADIATIESDLQNILADLGRTSLVAMQKYP